VELRPKEAASGRQPLKDAASDSAAQTITEYALIVGFVAIVVLVGLLVLSGGLKDSFFNDGTSPPSSLRPPVSRCDPNYEGACIPPYPPDLDCSDLHDMGIDTVRVVGSDPHGLDSDHDGVACNE
jgi:Flp pilus assembly pilin Flp